MAALSTRPAAAAAEPVAVAVPVMGAPRRSHLRGLLSECLQAIDSNCPVDHVCTGFNLPSEYLPALQQAVDQEWKLLTGNLMAETEKIFHTRCVDESLSRLDAAILEQLRLERDNNR
eukprot:6183653-Pleurochrysis_carterae.AAC.7